MECRECAVRPGSHSFQKIGIRDDAVVYYTSPARTCSLMDESDEALANLKCHLDEAKGSKWDLILDCEFMRVRHQTSREYTEKIVAILTTEHAEWLQNVWIIHPNIWIRLFVKFMRPFYKDEVVSKMKLVDGKGEILDQKLIGRGLGGETLVELSKMFAIDPVPSPIL